MLTVDCTHRYGNATLMTFAIYRIKGGMQQYPIPTSRNPLLENAVYFVLLLLITCLYPSCHVSARVITPAKTHVLVE